MLENQILDKSGGASWVTLSAVRNAAEGRDRHRCFKNSNPARACLRRRESHATQWVSLPCHALSLRCTMKKRMIQKSTFCVMFDSKIFMYSSARRIMRHISQSQMAALSMPPRKCAKTVHYHQGNDEPWLGGLYSKLLGTCP